MEGISIIEDYDGCVDGHGVLWYRSERFASARFNNDGIR